MQLQKQDKEKETLWAAKTTPGIGIRVNSEALNSTQQTKRRVINESTQANWAATKMNRRWSVLSKYPIIIAFNRMETGPAHTTEP